MRPRTPLCGKQRLQLKEREKEKKAENWRPSTKKATTTMRTLAAAVVLWAGCTSMRTAGAMIDQPRCKSFIPFLPSSLGKKEPPPQCFPNALLFVSQAYMRMPRSHTVAVNGNIRCLQYTTCIARRAQYATAYTRNLVCFYQKKPSYIRQQGGTAAFRTDGTTHVLRKVLSKGARAHKTER